MTTPARGAITAHLDPTGRRGSESCDPRTEGVHRASANDGDHPVRPRHLPPDRPRLSRRETAVMSIFVIVHGGFGGGWEWTPVAQLLRRRGHTVFTPTLTGMGERSHLGPRVGLSTHIDDVVAVLEFEQLHDVVLCGASYGGMATTGAADRAPERMALLIYLDALVPLNGQSGLDLLPEGFGAVVRDAADEHGHGWVAIPDALLPPEGLIEDDIRARYVARLRDQPVATFTEPLRLTNGVPGVRRAFVRCTGYELDVAGDPIEPMAARARAEGWPYRELNAPHDPHLFDPTATSVVLEELAVAALSDSPGPTARQSQG
jgi:pimeloyl-ACP methyl ester carboxylesterase